MTMQLDQKSAIREQLIEHLGTRKLEFGNVHICNYCLSINGLKYISKSLISNIENAYNMEFDHINSNNGKFDAIFNHWH